MKSNQHFLLAFSVLAITTTAPAQESRDRLYLNAGVGVALEQSVNVKDGDRIDFNPGFRFAASLGRHFSKTLSAEIETGLIYNTVDKIGGVTVSSYGGSANLCQIPLLANVIYTPPLKCPFKPFISVGAGGAATVVDLKTPLGNVNDMDFTFCYQGMAGVKYALRSHVELGLAYKFLGTSDHHWTEQGVTLDTERTMSHSILATLTWKF